MLEHDMHDLYKGWTIVNRDTPVKDTMTKMLIICSSHLPHELFSCSLRKQRNMRAEGENKGPIVESSTVGHESGKRPLSGESPVSCSVLLSFVEP